MNADNRLRLATFVRDKALDYVRKHGKADTSSAVPVILADFKGLRIGFSEVGEDCRLDVWQDAQLVYCVHWQSGGPMQLTVFHPSSWVGVFGEPIDRRYRAGEKLLVAFAQTYQRGPFSDVEGFKWASLLPEEQLRSFGFTDRAEFDAYHATVAAFARVPEVNWTLH